MSVGCYEPASRRTFGCFINCEMCVSFAVKNMFYFYSYDRELNVFRKILAGGVGANWDST